MLSRFKTLFSVLPVIVCVTGCGFAQQEAAQVSQPAGVIFENVRIFNRTSDQL